MDREPKRRIRIELDRREEAIVRALVAEGSAAEVASSLGLSERHTRRLLRALQRRVAVSNTHALAAWAAIEGWVEPSDLGIESE